MAEGKGSYSTATSLLILSLEETIKALIVFLHSEGYSIYRIKRVCKLFSHHKTRHDFAFFIDTAYDLIIVTTNCRKAFENKKKQSDELNSSIVNSEAFMKGFEKLCALFESVFNDKNIDKFDDFKNNGLYVDYSDRLFIPEKEITNEHYERVNQVLNTITKIYKLILIAHHPSAINRTNYRLYEDIKMQIEGIIKDKQLEEYFDTLEENKNSSNIEP